MENRGDCPRLFHWLDLLWGGFPGADAPSIGTEKTVYAQEGPGKSQ